MGPWGFLETLSVAVSKKKVAVTEPRDSVHGEWGVKK